MCSRGCVSSTNFPICEQTGQCPKMTNLFLYLCILSHRGLDSLNFIENSLRHNRHHIRGTTIISQVSHDHDGNSRLLTSFLNLIWRITDSLHEPKTRAAIKRVMTNFRKQLSKLCIVLSNHAAGKIIYLNVDVQTISMLKNEFHLEAFK